MPNKHIIKHLPLKQDLETKTVLKEVGKASLKLGELRGIVKAIPNQSILINTLYLQEAKASSEIENIITTHDELYKSEVLEHFTGASKEVSNYNKALVKGFEIVKNKGVLTANDICEIQSTLEGNNAGFRTQIGTNLKNEKGTIIYTPPQEAEEIKNLMANLEKFINDKELSDVDSLIKLAIIHHQFESIHPFYDGNGRTGRILNILYLILENILDLPVLYLSRYIIEYKQDYYRLLQEVREDETKWEEWILFVLKGITQTAEQTTILTEKIIGLIQETKHEIKGTFHFYSQNLINNLFKYPYTKIEFLSSSLNINRKTASKYLDLLSEKEIVSKVKLGRTNYYINIKLVALLTNAFY